MTTEGAFDHSRHASQTPIDKSADNPLCPQPNAAPDAHTPCASGDGPLVIPLVIRHATERDVPAILRLYDDARAFMRRSGNVTQWAGSYPGLQDVQDDLATCRLYVCTQGDDVLAVFFYTPGPDATYLHIEGAWIDESPYHVIHRIAAREGSGAGRRCIAWACEDSSHLRIDTHEDNAPMRHVLTTLGFVECGAIICNDGTPRVAYEYVESRQKS